MTLIGVTELILGIMGGMGPLATSELFRKIIETSNAHNDNEHMHIVIDNNTEILDRTSFICGEGEDPRVEMIRSAIKLEMMGADYIAIPCNTAHFFYDDIKKYTKSKILHMIDETAIYLKKTRNTKEYFLMATKGTYKSKIYNNIFHKHGLNILEPDDSDKDIIMSWIYRVKSSDFNISIDEFEGLINKYIKDKSIPIILGCTELPLLANRIGVKGDFIDPSHVIAKRCIEIANNTKT